MVQELEHTITQLERLTRSQGDRVGKENRVGDGREGIGKPRRCKEKMHTNRTIDTSDDFGSLKKGKTRSKDMWYMRHQAKKHACETWPQVKDIWPGHLAPGRLRTSRAGLKIKCKIEEKGGSCIWRLAFLHFQLPWIFRKEQQAVLISFPSYGNTCYFPILHNKLRDEFWTGRMMKIGDATFAMCTTKTRFFFFFFFSLSSFSWIKKIIYDRVSQICK